MSGVGTLAVGVITNTGGIALKNAATSAGFLEFFEDSDNGTNKVTLIGPAATADVTITLPAAADTLVGKATTDTLTNKSIDLDANTLTGTLAEFNTLTCLSSNDVPNNSTKAFGLLFVKGCKRVPWPAAKINALVIIIIV